MIGNRLKKFLTKFDHILLLGSLILFVSSPILEVFKPIGTEFGDLVLILIMISGLSVTYSHSGRNIGKLFYFGLVTIVLSLLIFFIDDAKVLIEITQVFQVFYFLHLTISLFRVIIKASIVSTEVLVNSVSGYLLIGIMWAIIIVLYYNYFPGSFIFSSDGNTVFLDSLYYSFVTLTTLGYGDYLPQTNAAKSMSILIAISGSFYTTIVLGMIVGKYISIETSNKSKK